LTSFDLPNQGHAEIDTPIAKNGGPSCIWQNPGKFSVIVSFTTVNKNGLTDIYRGHERGQFDGLFEPTTVEGYPAAFNDATDGRPYGRCGISVGIVDTLSFLVEQQGNILRGQMVCDQVKRISGEVIKTLKGGA